MRILKSVGKNLSPIEIVPRGTSRTEHRQATVVSADSFSGPRFIQTITKLTSDGEMPDILDQNHLFGIGVFQQPLDLVLVGDMRIGTGMKAQLQTKFLPRDVGHLVGGCDQSLPFFVIQEFRFEPLTGKPVGVKIVDQQNILGAEGSQEFSGTQQLLLQPWPVFGASGSGAA